jgi:hypothetical protein
VKTRVKTTDILCLFGETRDRGEPNEDSSIGEIHGVAVGFARYGSFRFFWHFSDFFEASKLNFFVMWVREHENI